MQRLAAAATTASALHLQQQHVRGLAAAAATAAAASGAEQHHSACASLSQDGQQSARLQGPDTPRDRGSPRGAGCESSSGGAAAASGEAALRLLLPSSGASAAAAIAKRGAVHPSRLPSRAARAEVSLSGSLAICSRPCRLLHTPRCSLILLEPGWGPVVLGVATAAASLLLCCAGLCRHAAADRPGGSQGGHAGSTSSSHCSHSSSTVRSWAQRRRQCFVDGPQQHSQHQHGRQRQATACAQHARCVAGQQHEWCRCRSGCVCVGTRSGGWRVWDAAAAGATAFHSSTYAAAR